MSREGGASTPTLSSPPLSAPIQECRGLRGSRIQEAGLKAPLKELTLCRQQAGGCGGSRAGLGIRRLATRHRQLGQPPESCVVQSSSSSAETNELPCISPGQPGKEPTLTHGEKMESPEASGRLQDSVCVHVSVCEYECVYECESVCVRLSVWEGPFPPWHQDCL